ncbi:anthranilate synthase component I [Bacillus oleivorans]|uniref:Anthranilate synthase component 1 n=1 Tax=Bacillus oleivorans TaxID=1448271 RepID=A0A285CLJ6_9BACI|nr:anthranilate synthase component I [Bacillus oleivorans]SNX68407.1 anthranilate synthase component I [Bacillus oleivorans]
MRKEQSVFFHAEEIEGDTLTPIVIFQQIPGKKKCLLESSSKHQENGRFSFIAANPYLEIKSKAEEHEIIKNDQSIELKKGQTIEILKQMIPHIDSLPSYPFVGGAVGVIGYDIIRQYENIGNVIQDSMELPDAHLMVYQNVCIYDHLLQKVILISVSFTSQQDAIERVEEVKNRLENQQPVFSKVFFKTAGVQSNTTKEQFIANVKKAKSLIQQGEIFQVVLSQRLQSSFEGEPFTFYRELRRSNPSPYMFYIDFSDYIVLGASPESLLKTEGNEMITNPIAGTRPRGKTAKEDEHLKEELLADQKERAEHDMLVDLSRNDLGRVAKIGTVRVSRYMEVEKFQHVMHLVSEVKGVLRDDVHPLDALAVSLPAGTVSGAPKIRAMTILNELEKEKRGLYSGAVGYISFNGHLDFALAIRTMIIKENQAYVQAGAGIVYDSDPEKEYEETLNKARSLLEVKS